MNIPDWLQTAAAGALAYGVLSAAVRALPDPPAQPTGFGQHFYTWFFKFTHGVLANYDKLKKKRR